MKQVLQSKLFAVFIMVLLGGFLVFYDLDDRALWQDEAETACVSQTITADNLLPKGYDGLNYFSQQRGKEYDENYIWKLHPWFQFYWTATSFYFLEESTFSARFPFALLGLATIILSYFLSLLIWKDKRTAWFTVVFFLISLSFLMLTRQARYYAPVMFFSVYACYGLFGIFEKKKLSLMHFGIATFLLFHSQYLFALIFWLASLIYVFSFHRNKFKKVAVLIMLLAIPNIIFLKWLLLSPYGEGFELGLGFSEGLKQYPSYLFEYLVSPFWLVVPLGFFLFQKSKIQWKVEERPMLFFLLLIIGNLLGLLIFGRLVFVRYLCGMIPFIFLIKGRFAAWLAKIHVAIPIAF
ncbi:MAG: glycosyltransferase family 39 protein [Flavobacteriales bacterium]|nr:glycosyltransferase family 39 protein [Flavobacteriales bacterium]